MAVPISLIEGWRYKFAPSARKAPDRKGYTQKKRAERLSVTGWRVVCQVRKPPRLPASPGEFNLACRERPAAKPAAMEIFHHGIDLPGGLCSVIRLAATVADVGRDIPDDDDLIPDPCNEFGRSLVQGSFTGRASLRDHAASSSEIPGKILGIDLRQLQNPAERADLLVRRAAGRRYLSSRRASPLTGAHGSRSARLRRIHTVSRVSLSRSRPIPA